VKNILAQKTNQLAAGGRLNPPVINQRKGNIMDKLTMYRRLPTILLPIALILLTIGSYSSTAANPVTPDSRSSVASPSFVWQKVNVGLEYIFAIKTVMKNLMGAKKTATFQCRGELIDLIDPLPDDQRQIENKVGSCTKRCAR
jgi:hypothetical protein